MTDIDFYVDMLTSGMVWGVGPGSTADEIEDALGESFVDDVRKQRMRRDYGLVEFQFNRVKSDWVCFGVSVQIHRVLDAGAKIIPPVLADNYGAFPASVEVGHLAEVIGSKKGRSLVREDNTGEFVRYRVDGTNSFVHARRGPPESSPNSSSEDVWSIEIREAPSSTARS